MNNNMDISKPINTKKTIKNLTKRLFNFKIQLIFIIITSIISAIFTIISPKLTGNITTVIFEGIMKKYQGSGSIDFDKITQLTIITLGLYIISMIFNVLNTELIIYITTTLSKNLRDEISNKINKLDIDFFEKRGRGDILSIITNDIDTLTQSLSQAIANSVSSIVTIIGILFIMFTINVKMTLVAILILPIASFIIGFIMNKSKIHFANQQNNISNINEHVEESLTGFNIIKSYNLEENFEEKFDKLNNNLIDSSIKSQFLSGLLMPIMNLVNNIGYAIISIMGGYYCYHGIIKIGDIQSFLQYLKSYTQPISQIAQITNIFQSTLACAERVFNFLEEKEEFEDIDNAIDIIPKNSTIEFKNVKFGYDKDQIIIKDFSLKVNNGKKIAIVGPTGAGKTTLIKLLMRFYDINSGDILINNNSIYNYKRSTLRDMFGMVLQETWLFNGSIMDNLKYSKENATDEEVINACKMAHAHEFILKYPDGYNTVLDEEASNLSQGQKQLLTIARAILKNPEIIILDEATSSVDTATEKLINEAMDTLLANKTSFVIAHRLSTIQDADTIICLKDGDIVEMGNHNSLLEKNGFYAELYNSQFQAL